MKSETLNRILVIVMAVVGASGLLATQVSAQTAELPRHTEPYSWSSGHFTGVDTGVDTKNLTAELAMSDIVAVPGSPWMQLSFKAARLGENSYVEITSILDGATQRLDAATLRKWNYRSAYFNGDTLEIQLYVAPLDKDVFVEISDVVVGEWGTGPAKSICGADDRVASSEARVGRIQPIGCTGWIVDNGKHVSAGHCLNSPSSQILEFNVPPSLPDGTNQHPGPEDQYSMDPSSFDFVDGGVGNDWGVFLVFDNTQTGLQPIDAQGVSFSVAQDLGPANIRITGFGVDSGVTNQTNQTHVGPNAGSSGTTMRYATDTTGGNSGSPVIDEATGLSVGVHTHGGCTGGGGNNSGTSFFRQAFWDSLGGQTGLTLSASGTKVKGRHVNTLTWSGAGSSQIDVYRDSSLLTTTANSGSYTDETGNRGKATYVYQVCEAGTSTCSNTATVVF